MVPRSSLRGARATKQSIRHLVQHVWRISRRRNPPHHLEPMSGYAALICPTWPTRPCRLTPPSPRLLVTGSNPQFTSRRAFGPPQVLDISQNGISARGAVSYRVPILSRMAITAAPWLPKFWRNAMLHYFLAIPIHRNSLEAGSDWKNAGRTFSIADHLVRL
jgi:hypothetical protein